MIHYLLARRQSYTMNVYLGSWGHALAPHIKILFYEQLPLLKRLDPGTYIFTDLEHLNAAQLETARLAARALRGGGDRVRLLNDPDEALAREPLLRALHANGLNPYTVHGVNEDLSRVKFPAFVRNAREHDGSQSDLVHTPEELRGAIEAAGAKGIPADDLLIVEYCDTGDVNGIYRKYSVTRAGERYIARHLLFGRKWLLKYADVVDDWAIEAENEYLATHPHADQIARVFEMAHIDYGRIDYAMLGDRVVTWEINTNPAVSTPPLAIYAKRLPAQWQFAKLYNEAMLALDQGPRGDKIPLTIPWELQHRLGITLRHHIARAGGKALHRLGKSWPWSRLLAAGEL